MYQREPILLKIIGLHIFNQPSRRLRRHPPLHVMPCGYKEGEFCCLLGLLFIAENKIKAFVYPISQSATLTALFTKESLAVRSGLNADLQQNKFTKEPVLLKL